MKIKTFVVCANYSTYPYNTNIGNSTFKNSDGLLFDTVQTKLFGQLFVFDNCLN